MIKTNIDELQQLKILIENQFRILNRKVTENDKNILRLLKKIENEESIGEYVPILNDSTIKIRSYMDN